MSTPLDVVTALMRQGRFTAALHRVQAYLTQPLPLAEQAGLTLTAGQCALQQGGLHGHHLAQSYFSCARELYEQLAAPVQVALAVAEQAIAPVRCGLPDALQTALQKLDEADTLHHTPDSLAAARIAHYRAVVYDRLGEKEHAFEYFTRAYELLQALPAYAAQVLEDLGTYYASLGKPHLARSCYLRSISHTTALDDLCGQAVTSGHLGRLLMASEQNVEAIEMLRKAIAMGLHMENAREVSRNYNSLAQAYMAAQDAAQAAQAVESCIRLASQHGFTELLAQAYVSQARLLRQQACLSEALMILREQAIPRFRLCLDAAGLATARQLEGSVLHALGKQPEAIEALREAAYLFRDNLRARELALVTLELADLYLDGGHPDEARSAVHTALDLAEKLGDTQLVRQSDILLERLDPKEAVQRAFRRVDGHDMGSRSFLLGGQREFLTVLMSDIVNFTAYAMDTELQEVTQTLNDYFTRMTDIVIRNHGYVDKYVGDGLMAIFRDVPGVGHHANRAVHAAIEMLERLRDFNKERTVHHQQVLHIRVGVHSGTAIIGNIGCYGKMDYTAIGTAVILASRLEQYAAADSVCISDATYQLLGGYFYAAALPTFVPKGFAEAQRVWQVLGRHPLLKFSVEFVAPDASITPHPGVVAIALGQDWKPGLIGRRLLPMAPPESAATVSESDAVRMASATAMLYAQPHLVLQHPRREDPSAVTLVLPRRPDFDTIVAAYFAQELLDTGQFPPHAAQIVAYMLHVQAGTLPGTAALWHTPYGVLLGIRGRNKQYCQAHGLSQTQQALYDVQRTFYFLRYLSERLSEGSFLLPVESQQAPAVFNDIGPLEPPFERERDFVRRDLLAYESDRSRATLVEVTLPRRDAPHALCTRRAIALSAPASTLFTTWAMQDAADFALVIVGEKDAQYCISVHPRAGVWLPGLARALNQAEAARRQQLEQADVVVLSRALAPLVSIWQEQQIPPASGLETARQPSQLTLAEVLHVLSDTARWLPYRQRDVA
ncbi:MAG: adenylate/guanylate cyclase domain-containing protein [Candidatus Tectimicrobiota bacterium]